MNTTRRFSLLAIAVVMLLAPLHAYTEPGATVRLAISGMHCGSCAAGITAMLKRTDGVIDADVKFETKEATVRYDSAKTSPDKIVVVVEKLGYKASIKK